MVEVLRPPCMVAIYIYTYLYIYIYIYGYESKMGTSILQRFILKINKESLVFAGLPYLDKIPNWYQMISEHLGAPRPDSVRVSKWFRPIAAWLQPLTPGSISISWFSMTSFMIVFMDFYGKISPRFFQKKIVPTCPDNKGLPISANIITTVHSSASSPQGAKRGRNQLR